MAETDPGSKPFAISMGLTLIVAAVWAVYGLSGAPNWLLVVGVLLSIFTGWWWGFGRRAVFPDETVTSGRQRNRSRRR